MSKPSIILIGAGGHTHSCIDVIEEQGKYKIAGLVGMPHEIHDKHLGYEVIASDDDLPELFKQYKHALVTVGQIKSPDKRVQLFQRLVELGFTVPTVISPSAYVSKHAMVGDGTIVMHGALINAGGRVGVNCIINTNSLVEHDATVGDHCHISTGSIVNGATIIQQKTFIGSNAMISNNIEVGENNIVKGGGGSSAPFTYNGYYNENDLKYSGFKSLGYNVKIAKNCTIIGLENIEIGNNVRIDGHCSIIAAEQGWIKIGCFIHIGAHCHLSASDGIQMDDFSGLSQGVKLYSGTDDYTGKYLTNPTVPKKYTGIIRGTILLERHVIIGSGSVILPKVTIGEGSSVGALSLVTKSLDSWGVYFGCPVKRLKSRSKQLLELETQLRQELIQADIATRLL